MIFILYIIFYSLARHTAEEEYQGLTYLTNKWQQCKNGNCSKKDSKRGKNTQKKKNDTKKSAQKREFTRKRTQKNIFFYSTIYHNSRDLVQRTQAWHLANSVRRLAFGQTESYSLQPCLPLAATIGPAGRSRIFFYLVRPASLMVGPNYTAPSCPTVTVSYSTIYPNSRDLGTGHASLACGQLCTYAGFGPNQILQCAA